MIQKQAIHIILPTKTYKEGLEKLKKIETLETGRE